MAKKPATVVTETPDAAAATTAPAGDQADGTAARAAATELTPPKSETPDAAAATAAPAGDQKDGTAAPAAAAATDPTPPATGDEGTATAGAGEPVPASAATLDPSAKGPEGLQVTVHGPAKGRWRVGRHFTPEPVVIQASDLTGAQAKQLSEDPELVCVWDETPVALAV